MGLSTYCPPTCTPFETFTITVHPFDKGAGTGENLDHPLPDNRGRSAERCCDELTDLFGGRLGRLRTTSTTVQWQC